MVKITGYNSQSIHLVKDQALVYENFHSSNYMVKRVDRKQAKV